jgi:hypothetical protein
MDAAAAGVLDTSKSAPQNTIVLSRFFTCCCVCVARALDTFAALHFIFSLVNHIVLEE